MKNLIIYTTKYGSVKKSAELLAAMLTGNTKIVDLSMNPEPDLQNYDNIILGGSIYAGKIQSVMQKFTKNHLQLLSEKKLGIFVNAAEQGERKFEQLRNSFPPLLRERAIATGFFGDEITWEKCSFIDRLLIRLIKGTRGSYSNLDKKAISDFAEKFNTMTTT